MGWTGLAYVTYRAASFEWGKGVMEEGFSQAVDYAQRAIDIDPRAADAYYAMGQSLNAIDELERAQAAHEKCIELNPSHAPAYGALAQIRMFLGYPEETAGLCAPAFRLSPREPLRAIWLRTRALAALFLGDAAAAAADGQAAIAINPEYPSAYVVLAAALVKMSHDTAAAATVARLAAYHSHGTIAAVRRTHARSRRARYTVFLESMLRDLRKVGLPD
jgi:tetratricopeptide (TPR) repeat protein